jgi:hypothetical protein
VDAPGNQRAERHLQRRAILLGQCEQIERASEDHPAIANADKIVELAIWRKPATQMFKI